MRSFAQGAALAVAALSLMAFGAKAQAPYLPTYDRVAMSSATTGTGTITLGAAISGPYQSFAAAGVTTGATVRYVIVDGSAWEIGHGVYTATGTTLSRNAEESSNGGSAITLDGSETIYLALTAADFQHLGGCMSESNAPAPVSGTYTIALSQGANCVKLDGFGTSAANIQFSNAQAGDTVDLKICNGSATAGAITFQGSATQPNVMKFAGGSQPGNTTAANECDLWFFYVSATEPNATAEATIVLTGMTPGVQ